MYAELRNNALNPQAESTCYVCLQEAPTMLSLSNSVTFNVLCHPASPYKSSLSLRTSQPNTLSQAVHVHTPCHTSAFFKFEHLSYLMKH